MLGIALVYPSQLLLFSLVEMLEILNLKT